MALLQCMNNAMVNHELAMNSGLNRQLGQQIVANIHMVFIIKKDLSLNDHLLSLSLHLILEPVPLLLGLLLANVPPP